jgi:hypothetical protein
MRAGRSAYCVFSVSGGDHRSRFFNFGNPGEFFDPTRHFVAAVANKILIPIDPLVSIA